MLHKQMSKKMYVLKNRKPPLAKDQTEKFHAKG